MGRPPKSASKASSAAQAHAFVVQRPEMKYNEAAHLADKTSRTMSKISYLLTILAKPGYEEQDPHRLVEKYIKRLTKRVNRRLGKLAKWSDSSMEERLAEFKHLQRLTSGLRQRPYSKPALPPAPAPAVPIHHSSAGGSQQPIKSIYMQPALQSPTPTALPTPVPSQPPMPSTVTSNDSPSPSLNPE